MSVLKIHVANFNTLTASWSEQGWLPCTTLSQHWWNLTQSGTRIWCLGNSSVQPGLGLSANILVVMIP